jgi:hypothetical protein
MLNTLNNFGRAAWTSEDYKVGADSMPGDTWKITTFGELNETSSTAKTLAALLSLPRWLSTRLQHTLHISSSPRVH